MDEEASWTAVLVKREICQALSQLRDLSDLPASPLGIPGGRTRKFSSETPSPHGPTQQIVERTVCAKPRHKHTASIETRSVKQWAPAHNNRASFPSS